MPKAKIISIEGAVDLHVHTGPSVFLRPFDDVETARRAAEAGIQAIWLKDHFESTTGRAYHASKQVPEVKVLGGIVLNRYVGGINPAAVEAALLMGAKLIMMPSIDAARHAQVYGKTGHYQLGDKSTGARMAHTSRRMMEEKGISILKDGELTDETKDVVNLVAEYDVILGTGHLSKEEIVKLADYANTLDYKKLLITHVDFGTVVNFELKELQHLINRCGIFVEFTAAAPYNPECSVAFGQLKKWMDTLKTDNCVISSDVGAPQYPIEAEALRIYAQQLYEYGVSEENINRMMVANPMRLLNL